jgi:hypothetical protein
MSAMLIILHLSGQIEVLEVSQTQSLCNPTYPGQCYYIQIGKEQSFCFLF